MGVAFLYYVVNRNCTVVVQNGQIINFFPVFNQVKPDDNGIIHNGIAGTSKASGSKMTSPTQFNAKVIQQNNVAKAKVNTPPTGVEQYNENLLNTVLLKEVKRPGKGR